MKNGVSKVYTDRPDYADFDSPAKFEAIKSIIAKRLIEHPDAICSYSGGSDSDIMLDLIERTRAMFELPPIKYVFFNTGLEMKATRDHVKYVAEKPYYENKYREVGDKCYHIGYSSYYLDVALEYRKKYFEVVERESDWIPCSERIPEEPKENPVFDGKCLEVYLVTTKYGSSDQDKVYPFRAFWNGINFTDGCRILDVIAWMPLPEPYKEKTE